MGKALYSYSNTGHGNHLSALAAEAETDAWVVYKLIIALFSRTICLCSTKYQGERGALRGGP